MTRNRGDCHGRESFVVLKKCLLQWQTDLQEIIRGPPTATPHSHPRRKTLMSHEAAEVSLSPEGKNPTRDPSWAMLRAHRFLPVPGTQGRTNQASCLSSPKENVVVPISPDNVCVLPGQSFFSFQTSQPCSGFWPSLERHVESDGKTCASWLWEKYPYSCPTKKKPITDVYSLLLLRTCVGTSAAPGHASVPPLIPAILNLVYNIPPWHLPSCR